MTTLEQRIQAAIDNSSATPWAPLIRLFEIDPATFYQLACDGIGEQASQAMKDIALLASDVRSAVQGSYEIARATTEAKLTIASGKAIPVPNELLPRVVRFLRNVDGKETATATGKDYVGTMASEAEIRFKLGDRSTWEADRVKSQAKRDERPLVLHVSDEEIGHLQSQPAYVTYGLLNCARKTVLAPTSVFKGLKRGDDCPSDLQEGWAFCGKPRQSFDNECRGIAAPEGMIYLVYANESGFVFDWDWAKESPAEAGYPLDWQLRFGDAHSLQQDAVLELPGNVHPGNFDATMACYSNQGDCIFCYMTDEISYAARINADLTVFKSIVSDEHTGFKIKNVRRIVEVDRSVVIQDDPDIVVSVESVLLLSRELHPDASIDIYKVLIELRKKVGEPPKVRLPHTVAPVAS